MNNTIERNIDIPIKNNETTIDVYTNTVYKINNRIVNKDIFYIIRDLCVGNNNLQQERNNYKELYEKENKNWNELKETLKEEIKYDENWYNPDCVEYIGQKRYPDDTIDGFRYVVEKMEDLERL